MGGRLVAVEGAVLFCTEGTSQAPLLATCRTAKFGGRWAANIHDFKPGTNIPSFGTCKKKNAPCTPNTCEPWIPLLGTVSLWQPVPLLSEGALLPCKEGGIINILHAGQTAMSIAVKPGQGGMCLPLPPGAARGGGQGGDGSACGADAGAGNACGTAASACGANLSLGTACGADASACGAAASAGTACGANASACGAAASAASACGANATACGAAASGATACGAALGGCGADASGAEACGVQTACAVDVCGADGCIIDITIFDASPVDVCAIDIVPVIPFI